MALNYTVKQGDCISSISYEYGFFPDTIWNHPQNKELKEKRKDPNVLMPGDVVFVPDLRVKEVSKETDTVHKFQLKNTPIKLEIQLMCVDVPLKDIKFKLDVDGLELEGKTDSGGWLRQSIPPSAKQAILLLENGSRFDLRLGFQDPIDEVSGLKGRLRMLGYFEGRLDGEVNDEFNEAIKAFQQSQGLEISGEADSSTKSKLKELTIQ